MKFLLVKQQIIEALDELDARLQAQAIVPRASEEGTVYKLQKLVEGGRPVGIPIYLDKNDTARG